MLELSTDPSGNICGPFIISIKNPFYKIWVQILPKLTINQNATSLRERMEDNPWWHDASHQIRL